MLRLGIGFLLFKPLIIWSFSEIRGCGIQKGLRGILRRHCVFFSEDIGALCFIMLALLHDPVTVFDLVLVDGFKSDFRGINGLIGIANRHLNNLWALQLVLCGLLLLWYFVNVPNPIRAVGIWKNYVDFGLFVNIFPWCFITVWWELCPFFELEAIFVFLGAD